MDNIVNLIKEQAAMADIAPTPKAPDEKAQIVIHFMDCDALVLRFRKTKDAEALYKKLIPLVGTSGVHACKTDMFDSTICFRNAVSVSYVDHAKRNKFVPC
jgi:hypothetical protein